MTDSNARIVVIQILLSLTLLIQRYNDTALVTDSNARISSVNSSKLNVTDQRYNETALVTAVNTSSNIQILGFNTTTQLVLGIVLRVNMSMSRIILLIT